MIETIIFCITVVIIVYINYIERRKLIREISSMFNIKIPDDSSNKSELVKYDSVVLDDEDEVLIERSRKKPFEEVE